MSNNLNDNLYKRFNLQIDIGKIRGGFNFYLINQIENIFSELVDPDSSRVTNQIYLLLKKIIREGCRQLFLDENSYNVFREGCFRIFVFRLFDSDFNKTLLNLQIFLNVTYEHEYIREKVIKLVDLISQYLADYPILGITIKKYKSKPPQIFPNTSKMFEDTILDTLELLDMSTSYTNVLVHFESGLKEFLNSNNKAQLKDVVEDMYTALDTLIQINVKNKRLGLRNLFTGKIPVNVGLNKWQLVIFKEMKDWMDKIKHASEVDYTKIDIETIILLSSQLIRTIVQNKK